MPQIGFFKEVVLKWRFKRQAFVRDERNIQGHLHVVQQGKEVKKCSSGCKRH